MGKRGVSYLLQPIKHFIFPPLCFHCDERIEEGRKLLCSACLSQLSPIDPKERCPFCFVKKDVHPKECSSPIPSAAVFEGEGAARSLLCHFTHRKRFSLARALAPFFITQLHVLKWPWPDLIIPVPMTLPARVVRGYNPALLLANEVARLLSCPVARPHSEKLVDKTALLIDCKQSPSLTAAALTAQEHFPRALRTITLIT